MLAPKEIPGYRIKGLIGAGGMSTVYEALELKLNRPVALKILHPYLLSDRVAVERFRREALAAARLEHPNIVRIHDYISTPDYNIIVMEFVPGSDLHSIVKSKGPLPPAAAFYIMRQIASALQAAHAAGIIHRDIKPSNILIHRDRRILLTDFGLARHEFDLKLTTGDAIAGTPQFMAPEQIAGNEITSASDVFSWAVTYYFALFSKLPYDTEDFVPLVNDIRSGNLKLSEDLHDLLSPLSYNLLARCLLPNAKERPRDGFDLLKRLDESSPAPDGGRLEFLRATDESVFGGMETKTAAKTLILSRPKRKAGALGGIAAMLVLVAVFLGLWAPRNSPVTIPPQTADDTVDSNSIRSVNLHPPVLPPPLPSATVETTRKKAPDPRPSPPDSGRLFIYSEPWAEFVIDGIVRGTAPMAADEMIALTEGKHVLTLYRESFFTRTDTIEIIEGKILRKRYSLQRNEE